MDSFVCFLMKNEFVDLDFIISNQVTKLIGLMDPDDICGIVDTIKTLIDMGFDTRKPIVFSMYDGEDVLSTLEDLLNMKYSILSDLRSDQILVRVYSRHGIDVDSICEIIIREMCGLQKYIGYKKRQCFLLKRIRGFSESDEPTEFDNNFINMEPELFARVLCFL